MNTNLDLAYFFPYLSALEKLIHINKFQDEINDVMFVDEETGVEDTKLFQENVKNLISKLQKNKKTVSVQEFADLLKKEDWKQEYCIVIYKATPWSDEEIDYVDIDFTEQAHSEIDRIFHEDFVKDECNVGTKETQLILN